MSFAALSRFIPILLTIFIIHSGCSSTPSQGTVPDQPISSTDEQIFVGDSVEMSYDPNVIMKRAESFFEKESYAEAIVEYNHFLDLHANHILAPYAQYKIGVSHFKQYRTVDRDPEPLHQSILSFEKLLERYPGSRYETEGKQTIRNCKEQLAQRHLMVGHFYLKRGDYLAAAHRFEKIISEYPELQSAGDAMFHLAKTYQRLGIEEWTQDWLLALVREHPGNPYHADGQKLLAKLQKNNPSLLASLPHAPSLNGEHMTAPSVNGQHTAYPSLNGHKPTPATPVNVVSLNTTSSRDSAPGKQAITPQTVQLTAAAPDESRESHQSCMIGNWCDSDTLSLPASPPDIPEHTKSCKTGEWC